MSRLLCKIAEIYLDHQEEKPIPGLVAQLTRIKRKNGGK